ncbi:MAG: N-6 DNA methylase [Prevotellaceae bacterium]|nr:N-6 DNA methylase [Prevotellaceae bacterium]
MITGEIQQKVDGVWQTFWNGGFTSPITILEQMTYLFFMKLLDDKQIQEEANAALFGEKLANPTFPDGMEWENPETEINPATKKRKTLPYRELRWSVFKNLPPEQMLARVRNDVFVFIRNMGEKSSAYSTAMKDTVFLITDARMLTRVVDGIGELDMSNLDMMGDVYEYMLSKMAASGTNGQFRTPRHIIRMMVNMVKPTLKDTICDPAMGSAGFLVESAKYIHDHEETALYNEVNLRRYKSEIFNGSDSDGTMMRIGCMNMMLHDVDRPQIQKRNSLSADNEDTNKYTLCLANPPFAGSLDEDDIAASLKSAVKTKKTELLFIALFMRMLKAGGRCASVVPDTVLTGDAKAYIDIRKVLVEGNCLQAVINMPSGVFQPYSGVSTAIVIFTKTGTGGTDKVWFYDMRADGYSLTTQRTPQPDKNDIPDIIARFGNLAAEAERTRKDQSFLVSADEIRKAGYDLSYKRYHEVEREAVVYDAPEVIIERMKERQAKIDAAFVEFQRLLNE